MRVYLPSTLPRLAAAEEAGEVHPIGGTAFAVTAELAGSTPESNEEELEYLAMADAARASLRLLGAEPDTPTLRVVIAADVAESAVRVRDDLDRAAVSVVGAVPWRAVAAVHIDGADAADVVRDAVEVVDAADLGDLDAEFVVGTAEDHQLGWYAPSEISYLLDELGVERG